jgi:formylglycine-generating enzyme required for sulfatase activity
MNAEIEARQGGYKLCRIPGGSFMMGSPENESGRAESEGPRHAVTLPDFYMGPCPVTNEEYRRFMTAAPNVREPDFWKDNSFNMPRQPVVGITFFEAKQYCEWAGLRLPSEAEWEYACRAGTTTRYHSGDTETDLNRAAWYSRIARRRLHSVGKKVPNAFGLYDMHGNVWEWCEDDWHDTYRDAPDDGRAWTDPVRGDTRVLRGGSWFGNLSDYLRSASRHIGFLDVGEFNVGFRCVLDV